MSDMRKLRSYEMIEDPDMINDTYESVFMGGLLNPRSMVERVELRGVSSSADMLMPSYTAQVI